jgi:MFS family permease
MLSSSSRQSSSRQSPSRQSCWLIVVALGLTQIIGYGTLYYAFSVLAPAMAKDLDWSSEWIFGALSAALLAGGFAAPWAGRWSDRFGAGRVMAGGSLAAALAMTACAFAPGKITFVLGVIAIEIASTFVLYNSAFTLLVQIDHARAARNITYLTLIAGFASTLLWPITSALLQHMSWREVYLVYAATHLVVCLPIHCRLSSLSHGQGSDRAATAAETTVAGGSLPTALRTHAFLLMAIGFSLVSFVNGATLVHMLPVLGALGFGAMGVVIGTVFGPAQVLSRLTNMVLGAELPPPTLAIVAAVLEPLAIAILLLSAPSVPGAVAFAIIFGLGSGLGSIIQGTLPLHLFGRAGYGELIGRIASVRLIVSAVAPFVFAFLMEQLSVQWALGLTAVLGVGALASFLWIGRLARS